MFAEDGLTSCKLRKNNPPGNRPGPFNLCCQRQHSSKWEMVTGRKSNDTETKCDSGKVLPRSRIRFVKGYPFYCYMVIFAVVQHAEKLSWVQYCKTITSETTWILNVKRLLFSANTEWQQHWLLILFVK